MKHRDNATESLPEIECACATVRRTARLVTQLYDEEFRGLLEAPQFGLLSLLDKQPCSNQTAMARIFGLDKTTLSRNLRLMEQKGWIERATSDVSVVSNDRRERGYRLTTSGRSLLTQARPGWRRAQNRLRSAMTGEQWGAMWQTFRSVSGAALDARPKPS